MEPRVAREAGADAARLTGGGVVVHHHHHGDLTGRGASAGRTVGIAVVATLESEVIAVCPTPLLNTTGEVVVNFEDVGNARIAELTEVLRVGVTRKSTAGFAERLGFVVSV